MEAYFPPSIVLSNSLLESKFLSPLSVPFFLRVDLSSPSFTVPLRHYLEAPLLPLPLLSLPLTPLPGDCPLERLGPHWFCSSGPVSSPWACPGMALLPDRVPCPLPVGGCGGSWALASTPGPWEPLCPHWFCLLLLLLHQSIVNAHLNNNGDSFEVTYGGSFE